MPDRPFLVLQARPEDEAADEEFASILARGGLCPGEARRVRLERDELPVVGHVAGVIPGGWPRLPVGSAAEKECGGRAD